MLTVEADEIVVNALCDRSGSLPGAVSAASQGDAARLPRQKAGGDECQYFSKAFGTPSDTKFSNVRLRRGDEVLLRTPSGGGYGPPWERPPERVARDVEEGYVTRERASGRYGVVVRQDGSIDAEATLRVRSALRAGDGLG